MIFPDVFHQRNLTRIEASMQWLIEFRLKSQFVWFNDADSKLNCSIQFGLNFET